MGLQWSGSLFMIHLVSINYLIVLKLADVACWPIHYTTLIEDTVSVCTAIIIRKTIISAHLSSKDEVKSVLIQLLSMTENRPEELLLG